MIENRVADLRKEQNMTQQGLSVAIGISHPALSAIENGTVPKGDTMLRLSRELGRPVNEIFLIQM